MFRSNLTRSSQTNCARLVQDAIERHMPPRLRKLMAGERAERTEIQEMVDALDERM